MEVKSVEIDVRELVEIMKKLQSIRDEIDSIIEELEIPIDDELMRSIERGREDLKKGNIYRKERGK